MWDTELGQDYVPKNADDFKRALLQLTHPQENRWGIGSFGTNATLFGLGCFAEMFNAPNNWKLDSSGKLIKDRETEEYKAAVGFMRDLFAGRRLLARLRAVDQCRAPTSSARSSPCRPKARATRGSTSGSAG